MIFSNDRIYFPVPNTTLFLNNIRALVDINAPWNQTTTRIFSTTFVIFFTPMTQVLEQLATSPFVRPDVPLDSFGADASDLIAQKEARDLVRAPLVVFKNEPDSSDEIWCHLES